MAESIIKYNSTPQSTTVSFTISGVMRNSLLYKKGNVCYLQFAIGNGTDFSNATGIDEIGTLPEGYRPAVQGDFIALFFDNGNWGGANYYPMLFTIDPNGKVQIRGKGSLLQTCKYGRAAITYIV